MAQILLELQDGAPHGPVILKNVQVVDPRSGKIVPDQTVIFSGPPVSRILWAGDTAKNLMCLTVP